MKTLLSEGIEELQALKNHMTEFETCSARCDELSMTENRLEKQVEAKEKAVADEITSTLKKRKETVEGGFDEQLDKLRVRIKKIKGRKDKVKDGQISERIEEATAGLKEDNHQIKIDAKELFKKEQVSSFWNTGFYYILFMPRMLSELLICILIFIFLFLALPLGIYFLFLPVRKILYLAGIYVADILIFGGLYLCLNNQGKIKHKEVIEAGRRYYSKTKNNIKRINKIQHSIKKDNDESHYDLEQFDGEIKELNENIEELIAKKKEALLVFESTTKTVITNEIKERNRQELEQLKNEYEEAHLELNGTEEQRKEKALLLTENYEVYLGKEFMTGERIDALLRIMEHGAATIAEAIAEYKKTEQ